MPQFETGSKKLSISSIVAPQQTKVTIADDINNLIETTSKGVSIYTEQKKKEKELKAKQQKIVVKEIRFGPQTDDHDYEFKRRHARSFLEEGSKLKAYVFFKGRSIIFKDQGEILLLRLAQELEDVGKVEQMPKLEGKRMIMMMGPKK